MSETQSIRDGGVLVFDPSFLDDVEADALMASLRVATPWTQEASRGRPFPRLTAWYADAGLSYSYSGVTHLPIPWTAELLEIKARMERASSTTWNSLLLNYYRDGRDSMGFHADDEAELGLNPVIGSMSLGASRRFVLKHLATRETLNFTLEHGSLLIMAGTTQHFWKHAIPKTAKPVGPRINLTFRSIERV